MIQMVTAQNLFVLSVRYAYHSELNAAYLIQIDVIDSIDQILTKFERVMPQEL